MLDASLELLTKTPLLVLALSSVGGVQGPKSLKKTFRGECELLRSGEKNTASFLTTRIGFRIFLKFQEDILESAQKCCCHPVCLKIPNVGDFK